MIEDYTPEECMAFVRYAIHNITQQGNPSQDDWAILAAALGRCRLFGVEPEEGQDGTLTVQQARQACWGLCRRISGWNRADPDPDPITLLWECRMDAWAVLVAVDEAYNAAHASNEKGLEGLAEDLNEVMDGLDDLDARMERLRPLMTDTTLLEVWRRGLAVEFAAEQPWWLYY